MQDHYQLLTTIYNIVKDDPQPELYSCRPRELILRQLQEWSFIHQEIQLLENEGLVTTDQQDTLIIRITSAGVKKVNEMESLLKD